MITIRLKKKPSFYVDLAFSHWLVQDKILGVLIDRRNRVESIDLDKSRAQEIRRELHRKGYL